MSRVEVVPHDARWAAAADAEMGKLRDALGTVLVGVHHAGSTSIPGIYAKPILDLLGEVTCLDSLDKRIPRVEELGYESLGEFGIPERRYFRKDDAKGNRTHHLHVFVHRSPGAIRHLAFRDYLRAHPELAKEYSELKRRLAVEHPSDIGAYMDGKDPFIKRVEAEAVRWNASREELD